MPTLVMALLCGMAAPSDMRFAMVQIDGGAAESAAVADFSNAASSTSYQPGAGTSAEVDQRPIHHPISNGCVDSLPSAARWTATVRDVIQIGYFARRIVWMKNPGRRRRRQKRSTIGPTEFAFLVDLDNDGKADDLLPQFTGGCRTR
jgi:hypothetical protein